MGLRDFERWPGFHHRDNLTLLHNHRKWPQCRFRPLAGMRSTMLHTEERSPKNEGILLHLAKCHHGLQLREKKRSALSSPHWPSNCLLRHPGEVIARSVKERRSVALIPVIEPRRMPQCISRTGHPRNSPWPCAIPRADCIQWGLVRRCHGGVTGAKISRSTPYCSWVD